MRILMLTRFSCSGSTGHVLSLAAKLNSQGVPAAVVMTDCPPLYRQAYQRHWRDKVPLITESKEQGIARALRHYRAGLIHVHAPALIPLARTLALSHRLPWGVSIHNGLMPAQQEVLSQASFLITGEPLTYHRLLGLGYRPALIPEGIDLDVFKPAEKTGFRITFIGEAGGYTEEGYQAVLKAAALADLSVDIICPEQIPGLQGRFHGWLPSAAAVLKRSQAVLGRRRSLLEGMASGCAALILGQGYGGIVETGALRGSASPDLSGSSAAAPCYRNIFYDLSRLIKDRAYLSELQRRGRKYIVENCDLRLSAELTAKIYQSIY